MASSRINTRKDYRKLALSKLFIMKTFKHSIGIDVSKDSLMCCIGMADDHSHSFGKSKIFRNDFDGFQALFEWCGLTPDSVFVMEATGVYYENLAYFLDDKGCHLSVVLPNKIKYYTKSLNVKTKTDGVDAKVLSRFGLERPLTLWHMPSPMMREIKFLSREFREIKAKLIVIKNQLHARNHSAGCPQSAQNRLKRQIVLLEGQLLEIEAELRMAVSNDPVLAEKISKIETIPGIGFMSITCILGETNAFALVSNLKQLASYAGLDVEHRQSGNKEGKTRISKKGNALIRQAVYMPALCASVHNPEMKTFYQRLIARKPAKKIAVTALARKLLLLTYVLWKNDEVYDPNKIRNIKKVDKSHGPVHAG